MHSTLKIFAILILFTGCSRNNMIKFQTETNPQYYQQWFDDHKNERGEIPGPG